MTDRNKFEEMLERLVNEDRSGAEELFHEIVVERSREIYENLLAEDEEEVDETTDEEVDESDEDELDEAADEDDEDEKMDEATDEEVDESDDDDLDESFFDEMGPADDAEGDMMGDIAMPSADDMAGDDPMAGDDMGMGGDDEIEDRVMDLEDELEALKAEFEAMMGDEAPADDEGEMDMDMGADDEGDDDEAEMPMDMDSEEGDDDEAEEAIAFEGKKSQAELMREYTDKVAPAKMGDNGANSKSTVAGKNDMGGTTANILRTDTEAGVEANKGNLKGSALSDQNPKDMNTKNVNVPGAKGATKMASQPGHGAEKKGKPETADKAAQSTLNKVSTRAK